jgi:hypothetical protein
MRTGRRPFCRRCLRAVKGQSGFIQDSSSACSCSARISCNFSLVIINWLSWSPAMALPFGRLWYGEPDAINNAIDYAKFYSRSHDAVIRVYDQTGNVIETHEHAGDFKEW